MNFGSQTWPISSDDFNLGAVDNAGTQCLGGIFDLDAGTSGGAGSPANGNPSWVIGDTFLVRISLSFSVALS